MNADRNRRELSTELYPSQHPAPAPFDQTDNAIAMKCGGWESATSRAAPDRLKRYPLNAWEVMTTHGINL
jgi:hypothetical protein